MIKKILQGIGVLVFLVAVAAISWITSYYVTTKTNQALSQNVGASYTVFAEDISSPIRSKDNSIEFEYYIVRLEGNSLNVYTCADNSEEFLYSEDIITSNLTKMDIEYLKQGTVLYTTSQLTEFMENFVS